MTTVEEKRDYRDTIFLPKTEFPMKAGLAKREPDLLARWYDMDLYRALRDDAKGRETFILHDGPPYANGNLHLGHALNKILKDMIVRSQQMMGKDSNYVPGWDCHGLPIEWKVEEQYRAKGKNKDDVPILEFRGECRAFADHWLNVQREEFKRLGVIGDWDRPYTTMSFDAEAAIVKEFLKFVMNGGLYRGSKPVMWSVVEKTALAEAEVEYEDHVSPTIWVKFPVVNSTDLVPENSQDWPRVHGANVIIWTTTPWTIPGNKAISYSPRINYGVYEVTDPGDAKWARKGERFIVSENLADDVKDAAHITEWTFKGLIGKKMLSTLLCHHPFCGQGYDYDVPLLAGDHVTEETGTGFVHTAPGHGTDDYNIWMEYEDVTGGQKTIPFTVGPDGTFLDDVPLFAGLKILHTEGKKAGKEAAANDAVIDKLIEVGALLARGKLTHSYPHSWRSKAPLIFRNTPQWFVSMEKNDLRKKALTALDTVRFVPPRGRNRLYSMIETRPDWVLSRQRAWGVPLTVFVHKQTGEILRDDKVNARIVEAVTKEGADAWFTAPERFLAPDYKAEEYDSVTDILDVWFDSGCTHAFVLENRDDLQSPADVYLEGSDQHRGWFHSSLLESCGTRGVAPYKAVVTHGFFFDEHGRKMSKSLGNQIAPQKIIERDGAEILRLWCASSDYTEDLRIGPEILKSNVDSYRKLRNTLRYLLGNLAGFEPSERVEDIDRMPELERFILHRLFTLDAQVRASYNDFDFREIFSRLFNFCTVELSALYFDVRKDQLYCDAKDDPVRRACRTVLDHLFNCLTAWFAPILCFTSEEAWLARYPDDTGSVHLRQFPELPATWQNQALADKWEKVRRVRRVVTGALEIERREKRIGSSLEAAPVVYLADPAYRQAITGLDFAEICITSAITIAEGEGPAEAFRLDEVPGVAVTQEEATGDKCDRCWRVRDDIGAVPAHPALCRRCAEVVG